MKLWRVKDHKMVVFECPGCGYGHSITYDGERNESNATWTWNGSMDKPTFTPSLLIHGRDNTPTCHSFVTDGKIQFLTDSTHKLAGQTVDLPEVDA